MSGGVPSVSNTNGPYVGADLQIYWDSTGTFFYKWVTGTGWVLATSSITADLTVLNTLILTGSLTADFSYPWSPQQNMGFYIATYIGGAQLNNPKDFCSGTINYYDVPQIPWLTLPIFAIAVAAAVALLYKYKFQSVKGAYGNSVKVG